MTFSSFHLINTTEIIYKVRRRAWHVSLLQIFQKYDNPTAWDGNAKALAYFNKYRGGIYTDLKTSAGNIYWNIDKKYIN